MGSDGSLAIPRGSSAQPVARRTNPRLWLVDSAFDVPCARVAFRLVRARFGATSRAEGEEGMSALRSPYANVLPVQNDTSLLR
jgi:hypothetical protein